MPARSKVTGTGFFVPEEVVTNDDLAKLMTTSDEWIQQRTGIKERRFVPEGMTNVDMSEMAIQQALEEAGVEVKEIDAIIAATLSPDYSFPSNAPFIQERLGLADIPAYDLRNQCTGFLYGMAAADAFIRVGRYEKVLVVGSEIQSRGLEMDDRSRDVTVIFGDGAGAFVMERCEDPDQGLLALSLHGDGASAKALWTEAECSYQSPRLSMDMIESGAIFPSMRGKKVFLDALRRLPQVINEVLDEAHLTTRDVDCFAFHQANLRINQWVSAEMNLPEKKVWNNIERYGNTTAATIPSVIHEAKEAGLIKKGSLVLAAAFGAGFTYAAVLIRW